MRVQAIEATPILDRNFVRVRTQQPTQETPLLRIYRVAQEKWNVYILRINICSVIVLFTCVPKVCFTLDIVLTFGFSGHCLIIFVPLNLCNSYSKHEQFVVSFKHVY